MANVSISIDTGGLAVTNIENEKVTDKKPKKRKYKKSPSFYVDANNTELLSEIFSAGHFDKLHGVNMVNDSKRFYFDENDSLKFIIDNYFIKHGLPEIEVDCEEAP